MAALVAVMAGLRARRGTSAGAPARGLEAVLLLLLGVTIAGGLGILAGGARPREPLHFVYAVVAVAVLPTAAALSLRTGPRARALIICAGALVTLAVVIRLFGTG